MFILVCIVCIILNPWKYFVSSKSLGEKTTEKGSGKEKNRETGELSEREKGGVKEEKQRIET